MPLPDLTPAQKTIVRQCLRIAVERTDMFPDWEFQTIFGVTREQMSRLVAQYPDLDESRCETRWAINNAMNNMSGYPHRQYETWDQQFPFSRQALLETFAIWRGDRPNSYFDAAK